MKFKASIASTAGVLALQRMLHMLSVQRNAHAAGVRTSVPRAYIPGCSPRALLILFSFRLSFS